MQSWVDGKEVLRDDDPDVAILRVLRPDATADPATDPYLTDAVLSRAYREMRRLRALDERLAGLFRQGRIGSHTTEQGCEAVAVAIALATRPDDWIFPESSRQGLTVARGLPIRSFVAQVFGGASDALHGRQVPGCGSARSVHQVSVSACPATRLPQAVGAAWAMRSRRANAVSVALFGERATGYGDFHAAMNFAGVFRAPCVLICETRSEGSRLPGLRPSASRTVAVKGRAYGVPGVRADGGDALAAHAAVSAAIERARGGGGPSLIEMVFSEVQPGPLGAADPIARLRRYLEPLGLVSEAGDASIDAEVNAEIDVAIHAEGSQPPPPGRTLREDVYAEPPWHL